MFYYFLRVLEIKSTCKCGLAAICCFMFTGIYRNYTEGVDKNAICGPTDLDTFCTHVCLITSEIYALQQHSNRVFTINLQGIQFIIFAGEGSGTYVHISILRVSAHRLGIGKLIASVIS